MKKTALYLSAFIIGSICGYLYFVVGGVASQYLLKVYIKYISNCEWPEGLRLTVYYLYLIFQGSLTVFPIFTIGGVLIAIITKNNPLRTGFLGAAGFICFYLYAHLSDAFLGFHGPIWFNVANPIVLTAIFILMNFLSHKFVGYHKKNKS